MYLVANRHWEAMNMANRHFEARNMQCYGCNTLSTNRACDTTHGSTSSVRNNFQGACCVNPEACFSTMPACSFDAHHMGYSLHKQTYIVTPVAMKLKKLRPTMLWPFLGALQHA